MEGEGEEDTREVDEEGMKLLIKMTRMTVKYFYEPKDLLMVDLIIKEKEVTERRFEDCLKFDSRLVRMTLTTLKNDKIISLRSEKEKNSDGKTTKVNYYFIKFEEVVNVVKYKLDNVRIRLQTMERELSEKKSFNCKWCNKSWTDLEAGELFNPKTLKFYCTLCKKVVEEDTSEIPTDTHQLVAKFNVELGPLYDTLQEIDYHFG